jgi:predicted ATP-grasp superfamily ATP-dependent carboligase
VLVFGNGITVLGVQRILAAADIPFFSVDRRDPFVVRSRFHRPLPAEFADPPPEGLDDWLKTLPWARAVLLPCTDIWVSVIAGLKPETASRFPSSISSRDTIDQLVDKGRFAATLARLGVPHPRSEIVDSRGDLETILGGGFEGAFLKPRDSARFFQRFRCKAFRADTPDKLAARLAQVNDAGLGVIVQEYIPGPPSNHYFIDGFSDAGGTVRALLARRRLRMHPPAFGNSTFMRSVAIPELGGAEQSLQRLLADLRYRGVFSAEFKLDPRDERFKLLEVNTRPWWYVEFAARCGVDVCSMAYRDALGGAVSTVESYRTGVACVYPYMDISACRSLRRSGELSLTEWARSWAGAQQPVFRWDDPWPATAALADLIGSRIPGTLHRGDGDRNQS